MKVIFMGSPEFAIPSLLQIYNSDHEIVACYTQRLKKAGRGQKLKPPPLYSQALELDIPIETPINFNNSEEFEKIKSYQADIIIVVAYYMILPKKILELTRYGCINLHPSLLPRWRGAAPLHRTIMHGDQETAVCIIQMDEGLDSGDIIAQKKLAISNEMTLSELSIATSNIGAEMIIEILNDIQNDRKLDFMKQSQEGIKYAHKIQKSEALIAWEDDIKNIYNKIRAFSEHPKCYFFYNNQRVYILESTYEISDHNEKCGHVSVSKDQNSIKISSKDGYIIPTILQRSGKKPMKVSEFLRGFSFF